MFSVERRDAVLDELLGRARADPRIAGAAVVGSGAGGTADRWSDLDVFLGLAPGETVAEVLADWSAYVYADLAAVHHFDLPAGPTTYRAFLLPDQLEIDLAFAPAEAFGGYPGQGFRLVFGAPVDRPAAAPLDVDHVVGRSWHHVLHARAAIARGRAWSAEHWISALRDHVLELGAHRHGLPTAYAKAAHRLPAELTDRLPDTLVRSVDAAELTRALRAVTAVLLDEVAVGAPELAARLRATLG